METIGSKRSYALIWCTPNNDDDDVITVNSLSTFLPVLTSHHVENVASLIKQAIRKDKMNMK